MRAGGARLRRSRQCEVAARLAVRRRGGAGCATSRRRWRCGIVAVVTERQRQSDWEAEKDVWVQRWLGRRRGLVGGEDMVFGDGEDGAV